MSQQLPRPPAAAGLLLDAHLHLLDRQMLDVNGEPVSAIDDVELSDPDDLERLEPDRPPVITNLLSGPVLATRVFGGRPPASRFKRIPWRVVADVNVVVQLGARADAFDATWTERWVRERIISRIPGGNHDPE